jgi:hypothetical protein
MMYGTKLTTNKRLAIHCGTLAKNSMNGTLSQMHQAATTAMLRAAWGVMCIQRQSFAISSKYFTNATIPPLACCQS